MFNNISYDVLYVNAIRKAPAPNVSKRLKINDLITRDSREFLTPKRFRISRVAKSNRVHTLHARMESATRCRANFYGSLLDTGQSGRFL
jgi:hypothetical protein